MNLDYLDAIKLNHSVVSFSPANSIFYISLWNGVLRDGKVDDIDILFLEAKNPKIINHSLSFDNKNIYLSKQQLHHLLQIFP
jgi:hypothetical protein